MKVFTRIALFAVLVISPAFAQAEDYPARNVQIVIPQSPGSSSDIFGRFVADELAKRWSHAVVIDNRPGASTLLGSGRVAKSRPDGYTLLFQSSTISGAKEMVKDIGFDVEKDLQPVVLVGKADLLMITGARTDLPTVASIVEQSKAQKLFASSQGPGSGGSLVASRFMRAASVKMEMVNYKSPPDALIDLAGGRVDLLVTSPATYLASGASERTKPVAVIGDSRIPAFPNVPTIGEAGYPDVVIDSWWGLYAPAGTPTPVLDKINTDVQAIMAGPEGVKFLEKIYAKVPPKMNVQETSAYVLTHYKDTAETIALESAPAQ